MRAAPIIGLCLSFFAAAALAQTAPTTTPSPAAARPPPAAIPPPAATGRGGDITRDEYVARAVERAKHAAEARFDRLDTNHDGILTADERRAARAARAARRAATSQ